MSIHTAIHTLDALTKRADALKLDEPLKVTLAELDIIRQASVGLLTGAQAPMFRGHVIILAGPGAGTDPADT